MRYTKQRNSERKTHSRTKTGSIKRKREGEGEGHRPTRKQVWRWTQMEVDIGFDGDWIVTKIVVEMEVETLASYMNYGFSSESHSR